jgi:hypothetical protein
LTQNYGRGAAVNQTFRPGRRGHSQHNSSFRPGRQSHCNVIHPSAPGDGAIHNVIHSSAKTGSAIYDVVAFALKERPGIASLLIHLFPVGGIRKINQLKLTDVTPNVYVAENPFSKTTAPLSRLPDNICRKGAG